jgi:hypothetical protein
MRGVVVVTIWRRGQPQRAGARDTSSASQFETFCITSVRLSLVTQEHFDFRMAFDFAGILRTPCQSALLQIRRYVLRVPPGVAQRSDIASSYPRTSPKSVLIVGSLASGYTREVGFLSATYHGDIINPCFVLTIIVKCIRSK